jgi:hypothetical protein
MSVIDHYRKPLLSIGEPGHTVADAISWDVIERVERGEADWDWYTIPIEGETETLEVKVFRDAMKLDDVRFHVNAIEQQIIADLIGGSLPTASIEDQTYTKFQTLIQPITLIDGKIAALGTAKRHSKLIDIQINRVLETLGRVRIGLVRSVGKTWILYSGLQPERIDAYEYKGATAFNYGWHSGAARLKAVTPPLKVYQSIGARHNDLHEDPSQTMVAVCLDVAAINRATGKRTEADIKDVLKDPQRASILSHEGPLTVFRMPRVPEPPTSTIVLPPTTIVP